VENSADLNLGRTGRTDGWMDGRRALDGYIFCASCALAGCMAGNNGGRVGVEFAGHSDSVRSGLRNHGAAVCIGFRVNNNNASDCTVTTSEFCNGPYKQPTNDY